MKCLPTYVGSWAQSTAYIVLQVHVQDLCMSGDIARSFSSCWSWSISQPRQPGSVLNSRHQARLIYIGNLVSTVARVCLLDPECRTVSIYSPAGSFIWQILRNRNCCNTCQGRCNLEKRWIRHACWKCCSNAIDGGGICGRSNNLRSVNPSYLSDCQPL